MAVWCTAVWRYWLVIRMLTVICIDALVVTRDSDSSHPTVSAPVSDGESGGHGFEPGPLARKSVVVDVRFTSRCSAQPMSPPMLTCASGWTNTTIETKPQAANHHVNGHG